MVTFNLPVRGRTGTAAGRIDRLQTGRIGTAAFSSRGGNATGNGRIATGMGPPKTALGGHLPMSIRDIKEGDFTKVIYTLIKNGKLPEAIRVLKSLLDDFPTSRPLYSLLGYCYYQSQLFDDAANWYSCPYIDGYI